MSQEAYIRSSLALTMTDLFPPSVQQAIMVDEAFLANLNLTSVGTFTFNRSGPSFDRSALMAAIRATSTTRKGELSDEAGNVWEVVVERDHGQPQLSLKGPTGTMVVTHLGAALESCEDRIAVLEAEAKRVNLPAECREKWAAIMSGRSLTADEVNAFTLDINATPTGVRAAIASTLQDENMPFDVLVPRSLVYFERLIGQSGEQTTISQYADEVLKGHMEQLLGWDPEEGMKQCLLLCGHPRIVEVLAQANWRFETYPAVVDWSALAGDAIARGAITELSILWADSIGEVTAGLTAVVDALMDDQDNEQFEIISALFIMVYGQLAHTKILSGTPLFWRRLAALSHAALIARCLNPTKGHLAEIAASFKKVRSHLFGLQLYADLRSGPRWQAQMVMADQLKNEFIGRLINRSADRTDETRALALEERIQGDGTASLKSTVDLFLVMLPGPTEGEISVVHEMPEEVREIVTTSLQDEKPTDRSFTPFINTTFVFGHPPGIVELAVTALQRANCHIDIAISGFNIGAILAGLASAAAVSRSTMLADAVLMAIRYHRLLAPEGLDLNEAVCAGLIACASRSELLEWSVAVGDLMSEFAFQNLSNDEAAGLHAFLTDFCDLVPELWSSCGPALAAFEALMTA